MPPQLPLAFHRLGEGDEHVVLLHGFLGSGRNLRGLAQRWSEAAPGRSFWMLDLPGHGQSPPVPDDADLGALAASVHATVASWDLPSPPRVVGHSLGGRVALAWLRAEPHALAALTLLDITPGPIGRAVSDSRRVLDALLGAPAEAPDRKTFRQSLVDAGLGPATADWAVMNVMCDAAGCRWRIDRAALDRLHERVNDEDLWPVVAAAGVPLRCVRGGRSTYVSDEDASRLERLGCRVDVIAGAGHDVHIDATDELVRLLG